MKELLAIAEAAVRCAELLKVKPQVHLDDHIFRFVIEHPGFKAIDAAVRYYFEDGQRSARRLKAILSELGIYGSGRDLSMLEFASGYGCVSRHFANELPGVRCVSCDIHPQAIAFLEQTLGIEALQSRSSPKEFESEAHDVVFALSFFSHMPERTWGAWVRTLFACVRPGGALIFTTHGQVSAQKFWKPSIPKSGFFFKPGAEQLDLDATEYGTTVVTEGYVRRELGKQIGKGPDLFREGFWWDHQDLYVVVRP